MQFKVFKSSIESNIGFDIKSYELLNENEFSSTFQFNDSNGKSYFFKGSDLSQSKEMFSKENESLHFIRDNTIIRTPRTYGVLSNDHSHGILMDWIDRKIADPKDMETFGIQIADMHQISSPYFGWKDSNFISILEQRNNFYHDWSSFYIECRITPLIKKGIDSGIFDIAILNSLNNLTRAIESEIPEEKPSLLHGDLWSGNYIISGESIPYLIDPSMYFGHREMDIAMSLMFGSFSRAFYKAYQNIFPLEKGFEERLPIHQLYPYLVHANLFQGQYIEKVTQILSRYN